MTRLRIAFLSASDPSNKRSWSGIPYYSFKALQQHVGDVHALGPYPNDLTVYRGKIISKLNRTFLGRPYDYTHSKALAKAYGKFFNQKLSSGKYDLVFACAASTETACIETDLPLLYFADATFGAMLNYYPQFSRLGKRNIQEGMEVERAGIGRADALLYASDWAAASAMKEFGADKKKIHVIPMGANIDRVPALSELQLDKVSSPFHLLFLGINWERKGGKIALETYRLLKKQNANIKLTICGCVPPENINDPGVTVIPFLNKNIAEESARFDALLKSADLLLLPTKAECFGVVFCEAAAYGLPSLSYETGGTASAIVDGKSGKLFPLTSGPEEFAAIIKNWLNKPEEFSSLRRTSRETFEQHLNWDSWAKRIASIATTIRR